MRVGGPQGVLAIESASDAIVIVDVLSFSTAVDIALSNGAAVLPYRWNDHSASQFAAAQRAILAGGRSSRNQYTLSRLTCYPTIWVYLPEAVLVWCVPARASEPNRTEVADRS